MHTIQAYVYWQITNVISIGPDKLNCQRNEGIC